MLKPRTVDGVLSQFTKLEKNLDEVISRNLDEAAFERQKASAAEQAAKVAENEASRAERVRLRIRELTA